MIDLTGLPIAASSPQLREFGGLLTPALGGPVQRIDRLGTRWAWSFQTAPMRIEPTGRDWAARIVQAKREGARLKVSQPDLAPGAIGDTFVADNVTAGRVVTIGGLSPAYILERGRWLSFTTGGRSYLDQVRSDAVANAGGIAVVTIQHLLRAPLVSGDDVEVVAPRIEGWIDDFSQWALDDSRTTSFSFTIAEAA